MRPRRDAQEQIAFALILALALLILSPRLLLSFGAPGFLFVATGTTVIAVLSPTAAFSLLVATYTFQNAAISFWINPSTTAAELNLARGMGFVIALTLYAAVLLTTLANRMRMTSSDARSLRLCLLIFAVLAAGSIVGMNAGAAWTATAAYARNMAIVPLGLSLGILFRARSHALRDMCPKVFISAFCCLVGFGYLELAFRDGFLGVIGMGDFLLTTSARANNLDYRYFLGFSQWLQAQEMTLFNDPLFAGYEIQSIRLFGPTAHPISFAYALAITSIPLLARAPLTTICVQVPIQYAIGSKGAAVLLIMCCAVSILAAPLQRAPARWRILALALPWGVITFAALAMGLRHGDYHVLGLLGGIRALLSNPLGHGLGTAGNLTEAGVSGQIDWSMIQNAGSADRGIESAVGVLLDQLGIFACVYFIALGIAFHRLVSGSPSRLHLVLAAAGVGLAANGFLQEEALFSPASAGLLYLLIGVVIEASAPTSVMSAVRDDKQLRSYPR